MKRFTLFICVVLICTSCSILQTKGKQAAKEQTQRSRIESVQTSIANNNTAKLDQIGQLSYGIAYTLSKADKNNEVFLALGLTERIMTLSGKPDIADLKTMQVMCDGLLQTNAPGTLLLNRKDIIIHSLEDKTIQLEQQKIKEIQKYISIASLAATKADKTQSALNEYTGWFGIKAIYKGIIQMGLSAFWFLIIGGVLFIILRILSTTNPIAAAIYSIFNVIGSWFINIIKYITPKAIDNAKLVTKEVYDTTKQTLVKTVDAIESTAIDTQPIKDEVAKTMDTKNKDLITTIKKELNYK